MTATSTDIPRNRPAPPKLGEELPIFCEKCGYSLHGLPQVRCERCEILQFHCPECAHHQPINTLRPAAQRVIGRLRATWLVGVMLFKLNYFGWLLFAWVAMGVEWSYRYTGRRGPRGLDFEMRGADIEAFLCFMLLALPFAMVGRMLLLRWRRGVYVGLVLGVLVMGAVLLGVWIRSLDVGGQMGLDGGWQLLMSWTFIGVVLGATVVWPIWTVLARVFLPASVSKPFLEWQKAQSDRSHNKLASH